MRKIDGNYKESFTPGVTDSFFPNILSFQERETWLAKNEGKDKRKRKDAAAASQQQQEHEKQMKNMRTEVESGLRMISFPAFYP